MEICDVCKKVVDFFFLGKPGTSFIIFTFNKLNWLRICNVLIQITILLQPQVIKILL